MKRKAALLWLVVIVMALTGTGLSQPSMDRIPVPLTDPGRPVHLSVGLINGSIVVKGYSGKEVIVEATLQPGEDEEEQPKNKKSGTMKLIPNTSTGLTVEEENNEVTVSTGMRSATHKTDLSIQVPTQCSMKLSTVNDGDIEVENVTGDLEMNNVNGSITLKRISGSAVAQTTNGEVLVTFASVNPGKAMSFSSFNGDVDVTFPASIKATVSLKSDQGEIYSDFDMQMQKDAMQVKKNEGSKGKFRVSMEKGMHGTINGGGQEIQFNNFNGNIYIRKGN